MTRGWWRIVDPDQVKTYVDALHPRGVREKELSRMLTRFMDFARESCLKVKIKFHFLFSYLFGYFDIFLLFLCPAYGKGPSRPRKFWFAITFARVSLPVSLPVSLFSPFFTNQIFFEIREIQRTFSSKSCATRKMSS